MNKQSDQPLFKKGIWIKEQQGSLTMGTLNDDSETMIIPEALGSKIIEFENDMIEALYGERRMPFNAAEIDMKKVFSRLKKDFKYANLRISLPESGGNQFKGDFDEIYNLLQKIVSSALPETPKPGTDQKIYINASILENHLCIIFRDTLSISTPARIKDEIRFIEENLNGEISFKSTGSDKTYYDIMIPSKE